MMGCRSILVTVLALALGFLPIYCPCTDSIGASLSPYATASLRCPSFAARTAAIEKSTCTTDHPCDQCPDRSGKPKCHQHLLRAMPTAPVSLNLPQSHHLMIMAENLLVIRETQVTSFSHQDNYVNIPDRSALTLLCRHCALVI